MYSIDTFMIKFTIIIVVIITTYYFFVFTKLGKYCRAIGSGETAAKYSGVPVDKIKILAFVISGFLCRLCGFFTIVRTVASTSQTGMLFETDVLTALVLGGMPLTGGSSARIQSAIIGGLNTCYNW